MNNHPKTTKKRYSLFGLLGLFLVMVMAVGSMVHAQDNYIVVNSTSDEVYPYLSVLAYGYAAGQLGDSVQSPDKIAGTIQSGGNVCQELVGMELVEVYRKSLSP